MPEAETAEDILQELGPIKRETATTDKTTIHL